MNPSRTYGVEIEFHSNLDTYEMARKIREAISQFGHTCSASGYSHQTDGANLTNWVAKTDSSLSSGAESIRRNHPYNLEVVSPVLRGAEGMAVLKVVCETIAPHAKISRKCGLHVHHGVADAELKAVVNGWLAVEPALFTALPMSRRDNGFCMRLAGRFQPCRENQSVESWWAGRDRYYALNVKSFWMRKTVEVRCAAGSVEFAKISNWTVLTQAVVDFAVAGAFNGRCRSAADVADVLKNGNGNGNSAPVDLSNIEVSGRGLNKMIRILLSEQVVSDRELVGWVTSQLIRHDADRPEDWYAKRAKSKIAYVKREARKSNAAKVRRPSDNGADADVLRAADWLVERAEHFAAM
jgi:hypothetical protein